MSQGTPRDVTARGGIARDGIARDGIGRDGIGREGAPSDGRFRKPRPAVLLVTGSHGFPATHARFARGAEIARELTRRGCAVDWVVLVERPLEYVEEDELVALRSSVRDLQIVDHPVLRSPAWKIAAWLLARMGLGPPYGGAWSAPRPFLRLLRSFRARKAYEVVIASGAHIAKALALFPAHAIRILDVPRLESETLRDHVLGGRADGLASLPEAPQEMRLLEQADAALVACQEDAVTLRARGFGRDLVLVPPTGLLVAPPGVGAPPRPRAGAGVGAVSGAWQPPEWHEGAPSPRGPRSSGSASPFQRPGGSPQVLYVGSETTANLDGLRWFRKQVLPRLVRIVPTARLRVVGEVCRHIDPDPGVDRMGRVEDLEAEYAAAAAVILPLRFGSGIRRRAVEALVRGKVLATSPRGAAGTGITHGRDAIVSDDPEALAEELGRVLSSVPLRRDMEARALRLAEERFAPEGTFDSLARFLGLPKEMAPARTEILALSAP